MNSLVRQPAVAGAFYPDNKELLSEFLEKNIEFNPQRSPPANAVIVPHAGYQYSGATAARAFSQIYPNSFDRAILIGPTHHIDFEGISIAPYERYSTPIGEIEVDVPLCNSLLQQSHLFVQREEVHRHEHALEVELPFLQTVAPQCKIIPLIVGRLHESEIKDIAHILVNWWSKTTLFIVSSDFVHYGSQFGYLPFPESKAAVSVRELDMGAIDKIRQQNASQFMAYVQHTGATICGKIPISILLSIVELFDFSSQFDLINYTSSGKILKDHTNSVSYAALTLDFDSKYLETSKPLILSNHDKLFLTIAAFKSIESILESIHLPTPNLIPPHLQVNGSVFVSLHINKVLRGCIGSLAAYESIIDSVISNAEKAAFADPRFPKLTINEFKNIDLEISVLTPSKRVKSIQDIVIGKHGIILERGRNRAVFLPQVAIEHNWDLEETLEILSEKAGIDKHSWAKEGTIFSVFETIKFGYSYTDFCIHRKNVMF